MAMPVYLVTKFGLASRRTKGGRYLEPRLEPDRWHVGLIHGYYVGQKIDLWYPSEGQADVFSLNSVYAPVDMIKNLGPVRYQVTSIAKVPIWGTLNKYTDKPIKMDGWRTSFDGDNESSLDLLTTVEMDARSFQPGRTYTPLNIFGTLRDVPSNIARFLEERYRDSLPAEPPPTDGGGGGDTGGGGGGGTGGGGGGGGDTGGGGPTETEPTPLGNLGWWWITNGGDEGYYNQVYFQNGTFLYRDFVGTLAATPRWEGFYGPTQTPINYSTNTQTPPNYRINLGGDVWWYAPVETGRQYSIFQWYGYFYRIGGGSGTTTGG